MDERDFDNIPDHCVISLEEKGCFRCTRCGASYMPALPCSISMYLGMLVTFGNDHKDCGEAPGEKDD